MTFCIPPQQGRPRSSSWWSPPTRGWCRHAPRIPGAPSDPLGAGRAQVLGVPGVMHAWRQASLWRTAWSPALHCRLQQTVPRSSSPRCHAKMGFAGSMIVAHANAGLPQDALHPAEGPHLLCLAQSGLQGAGFLTALQLLQRLPDLLRVARSWTVHQNPGYKS